MDGRRADGNATALAITKQQRCKSVLYVINRAGKKRILCAEDPQQNNSPDES